MRAFGRQTHNSGIGVLHYLLQSLCVKDLYWNKCNMKETKKKTIS